MTYPFAEIAFTDAAKAYQREAGSRANYEHMELSDKVRGAVLGADEQALIEAADSFYLASVNPEGWPYIQHRGGPRGFIRVIGTNRLGFADYSGNRQYVSLGNLATSDKVSLFFMDYARRARLKIFATARPVPLSDGELPSKLLQPHYRAKPERFMVLEVQAYDWNCPQHITQRFTMEQIEALAASQQGHQV